LASAPTLPRTSAAKPCRSHAERARDTTRGGSGGGGGGGGGAATEDGGEGGECEVAAATAVEILVMTLDVVVVALDVVVVLDVVMVLDVVVVVLLEVALDAVVVRTWDPG
jgi:hypothetical protein